MPIRTDEFEAGRTERDADGSRSATGVDPDSAIEEEKRLILAFLSRHHDRAFTEREIVMGVDFSPMLETGDGASSRGLWRQVSRNLGHAADRLTDVVGDAAATAVAVDDIDEALSALVEEGSVETREIETETGTTTYYRLADGE